MADETPAPLGAEELADVRLRILSLIVTRRRLQGATQAIISPEFVATALPSDVDMERLLATLAAREAALADCQRDYTLLRDEVASPEITRLESENAAYREIVAAVADRASTDAHITPAVRRCQECGVVGHEPLAHEPGCLAAKARALLATSTPPATDATAAQE